MALADRKSGSKTTAQIVTYDREGSVTFLKIRQIHPRGIQQGISWDQFSDR